MPLLVYGILRRPVEGVGAITGVRKTAVFLVEGDGLWAGVSDTPTQDGAPSVADLLAYGEVVESLHHMAAVIPMRYGCFFAGVPELLRLLTDKKQEYLALLQELEGRVEMGVRILLPQRAETPPGRKQPVTGCDYLAARRAHYTASEAVSSRHQPVVNLYDQVLGGLCSKSRSDVDERGGRVVLSLYYLIPKNTVGWFLEAFARITTPEGAKALVSGPWPPYSFTDRDLVPSEDTEVVGEG